MLLGLGFILTKFEIGLQTLSLVFSRFDFILKSHSKPKFVIIITTFRSIDCVFSSPCLTRNVIKRQTDVVTTACFANSQPRWGNTQNKTVFQQ